MYLGGKHLEGGKGKDLFSLGHDEFSMVIRHQVEGLRRQLSASVLNSEVCVGDTVCSQ